MRFAKTSPPPCPKGRKPTNNAAGSNSSLMPPAIGRRLVTGGCSVLKPGPPRQFPYLLILKNLPPRTLHCRLQHTPPQLLSSDIQTRKRFKQFSHRIQSRIHFWQRRRR